MGSCVSFHRESDSALNLGLSSVQSKDEKLIISSPVKLNSVTVNGLDHAVAGFAVKSQRSFPRFRDDGSKDEAFFDSQPWLESDCEDDFRSVNGDFTPSRGSTPVHHKFSSGNPAVIKPPLAGGTTPASVPEPSPKKRLSELFKESLRHHEDGDDEGETSDGSPVTENGANSEVLGKEEEPEKTVQCCLPGLRSSRSFSDRKKKASPPNGTTS